MSESERRDLSLEKASSSLTEMYEGAQQAYDLFRSFMVAGFTESQAPRLVANVMAISQEGDGRKENPT